MVFGTYNRFALCQQAVESARQAADSIPYNITVVDGGSTDGTREWLCQQKDVTLICQTGELTGAVRAFNLGFAHAVDAKFDYIFHFNDDAQIVTPKAFVSALDLLESNQKIGEVAFQLDLRGQWDFEWVNGHLYANFGMIRREAGIEVAKIQGDPTGHDWWNPIYRTYGADSEFGCHLWRLGWTVFPGVGLQVHDLQAQDILREKNESYNPNREDSRLFWERFRDWSL